MENASKALIIAGSILLAILIIGLGMYIYNNAVKSVGNTDLRGVSVQQFNSTFTGYAGKSVDGSKVTTLLTTIATHNLSQEDSSMKIGIVGLTNGDRDSITTKVINDYSSTIAKGKMYNVEFDYDNNSGYITSVKITENK